MPPTSKPPVTLDLAAIKTYFRPKGPWICQRGAAVRARRIEVGLTKIELAERCQIREMTVYRIEAGIMSPSDGLRAVIAHALGSRPDILWTHPSDHELELVSAGEVQAK